MSDAALAERSFLIVGLGVTGRAVTRALARRGLEVHVSDDAPGEDATALARDLGIPILDTAGAIAALDAVDAYLPTPGLAASHPVALAAARAPAVRLSEFDLARAWDDRPIAAVTGTNGKTTVTELVADMLRRSGIEASTAGNTEVPLVDAIDDPGPAWFVVEASSFRLGHSRHFGPEVGTWLNFAPDHLDVHRSLEEYERAKARMWGDQRAGDTAVANHDDPVVWSHAVGPARVVSFGLGPPAVDGPAYGVVDDTLVGPGGVEIVAASDMTRALPHDRSNALAAVATAVSAGANLDAARAALVEFRHLAHRVELIGERDGVRWFDDSKATVPHAVRAAVKGFSSVVLIAGGRNKGLELAELGELSPPVRAVVGIGECGAEVLEAFEGLPSHHATSMDDAVDAAASLAGPGDVVLLSPGCASFDWYAGYAERGDDFARAVRSRVLRRGSEGAR